MKNKENYYYKRLCVEATDTSYPNDWGTCTYYFKANTEGGVEKQLQVFENGRSLRYSVLYPKDNYGQLTAMPLNLTEFEPFKITEHEFLKTLLYHNLKKMTIR